MFFDLKRTRCRQNATDADADVDDWVGDAIDDDDDVDDVDDVVDAPGVRARAPGTNDDDDG